MKQVQEPRTLLYWDGELVEVVGISEGKTIHMQPVNAKPCEHCGATREISMLEHSPLFQSSAEPVETITVK